MELSRIPTRHLHDLDEVFDLSRAEPVVTLLKRLVELAVTAVDAACHSSVTLGAEKPGTPAWSDEIARDLDAVQLSFHDGPCVEASRGGGIIRTSDLANECRWPRFAEEALRRGVNASISVPLATRSNTMGSLNLYADSPGSFDANDELIGELIASRAAVGIVNAQILDEAMVATDQLREALMSRDIIGQAKGILMATEACSDEESFRMLVTASQHSNRKLREVAQAILDNHNNTLG
jgi:GAF domain-containing protein